MEPRLWACLVALAPFFPSGAVMDAGANDGSSSLLLAKAFPARALIAIEPIRANVAAIRRRLGGFPNATVVRGGLGAARSAASYPREMDARRAGASNQVGQISNYAWQRRRSDRVTFPVLTVDSVFENRRLGFAHWDVEGGELDLLRGAVRTIMRDRPWFTLETFPKTNPALHRNLTTFVTDELRYRLQTIREVCGRPRDCRNMLAVPSESFDPARHRCPG